MKNVALIPAYNEEDNILKVIQKIKELKKFDKIIVVDDGSKDKTVELVKKSNVILLRHEVNKGKGEAIKTGFRYIKKIKDVKNIIIIDADLQYEPKESLKILEKLENADFVIGYRNFSKIPLRHRLGNFFWRVTFNLFFGSNFKDTNCGLIGLSKNVIDKVKIGGGYIIENYMLASVIKNKISFDQVPVSVAYDEKSKVRRGTRVFLGVFLFIIEIGIKYRTKNEI